MDTQNAQPATAGFRLSPQQEQMWAAEPDGPRGRSQCAIVLPASIDTERVRSALGDVLARHEILRTTFGRLPGIRYPQQIVHRALEPDWNVRDGADGVLADSTAQATLLEQDARARLDLQRGPTIRATLLRGSSKHVLALTVAAVCADAESLLLVSQELNAAVGGSLNGAPEPLQYADFAEWRAELLTADDGQHDRGRSFWAENDPRLVDDTSLPFARVPSTKSAPRERVEVDLPSRLGEQVAETAARFDADSRDLLEACLHAYVARLTGASEVVVASRSAARSHDELAGAAGPFAVRLPIRSNVGEETSFAELLDQVRRAREETVLWEDYLSTEAMGAAAVRPPIGFTYIDGSRDGADEIAAVLRVETPNDGSAIEFAVLRSDSLKAELRYDPAVYDRDDVTRFGTQLVTLVRASVADPTAPVAELQLLPNDTPIDPVLAAVNDTGSGGVAAVCVHEVFEAQAARTPSAPAVGDGESTLSYSDLNARANQLAHRLREDGVGRDDAVGLCADRSVNMVVGLLGILKSGAGYVPLNFEHPQARLDHQLRESGAKALVTLSSLADKLPAFDGATILLDDDAALDSQPTADPDVGSEPADLVYVLYTSGSTGTPKGVAVTHANLLNYTTHMLGRLGGGSVEGLSFGVVSAISTDLGNTAVFPCLLGGGSLHLISPERSMDGALFAEYIADNPIDVLKITPSHLRSLLAGQEPARVLPRRWLILGGEAASWELVSQLAEGSRRLLNHYGPTETTVGSCTFDIEADHMTSAATVPIGRPISNTRVHVVDRAGRALPVGVPGELLIAGAGVARGYVGQLEQTAAAFVQEPGGADGDRAYRTGDRVRLHPDGNLEFLGRIDQQVKIRGFRVEPGEVESVLLRHPDIQQTAVVPRGEGEDMRLVAYLVSAADLAADALRTFLQESLPDYMVPSTFAAVPALPLTPSGKIDRLALPDEQSHELTRTDSYVAPRSSIEEELAEIWADVLGVEKVGVTDDFFALGGHSLIATQVVARARSAFDVDMPLHALFTAPTIEQLAVAVADLRGPVGGDGVDELLAEVEALSDEEVEQALLADDERRSGS